MTIAEFSRNAVESFVQTVVFVDDRIYESGKGIIIEKPKLSASVKKRKFTSKSKASEGSGKDNIGDKPSILDEQPQFSPHDIQASFAKKSIVCSLHQPLQDRSVGTGSDTYKLCAAADIIIVDWDLYGDAGEKAQELVENIIVQSLEDDPHQLRLVLIYTDNPNLFDVANTLYERLSTKVNDINYPGSDGGLAFNTLNARVVVLGKPAHRIETEKAYEVDEAKLADRAIAEFGQLADGLLQGCILMGLAEIRKQSRKIITKFHSGLDAAFLTHRALGLPHEEAFDHVAQLLVSEIDAVLEDGLVKPLISEEVLENWSDVVWKPASHAKSFVPNGVDVRAFSKAFCKKGMRLADDYEPGNGSGLEKTVKSLRKNKWPSIDTDDFKSLTVFHSKNDSSNDHRELAMLMGLRTHYRDEHRLTLGTIIREINGEQRYLLCLQPPCDSVRLNKPTIFLFCVLEKSSGNTLSQVIQETNEYVDLSYKERIENALTLKFKPIPRKGLVATKDNHFSDTSSKKYKWIAQLKAQHAQRAVEAFARKLSRVGLTESEWLRLKTR